MFPKIRSFKNCPKTGQISEKSIVMRIKLSKNDKKNYQNHLWTFKRILKFLGNLVFENFP